MPTVCGQSSFKKSPKSDQLANSPRGFCFHHLRKSSTVDEDREFGGEPGVLEADRREKIGKISKSWRRVAEIVPEKRFMHVLTFSPDDMNKTRQI
jgi:hypothetical protein